MPSSSAIDAIQRLLQQADNNPVTPDLSPVSIVAQHHSTATPSSSSSPPPSIPSLPPLLPALPRPLRLLILDHFDSFTHNLTSTFHSLTSSPPLTLYSSTPPSLLLSLLPHIDAVIISPGPGHPSNPSDLGCTSLLLPPLPSSPDPPLHSPPPPLPLLGVCLGLQALVASHGGHVVRSPHPMHGQLSLVYHSAHPLFAGIPSPFPAVRYNSLTADPASFPSPPLTITAVTPAGEVMAVSHATLPLHSVQFHPESVCTGWGRQLLANFITLVVEGDRWKAGVKGGGGGQLSVRVPKEFVSGGSVAGAWWEDWVEQATEPTLVLSRSLSSLSPLNPLKPPPTPRRYGLLHHALHGAWHTESLFVRLYGRLPSPAACWWLDSSRVERGRSRFSFMGDGGGPLSSTLTYNMHTRTVRVTTVGPPSEHTHPLPPSSSFFSFLQSHLDAHSISLYTPYTHPSSSHDDPPPPFPFHAGFVGYFAYELCHETLPSGGRGAKAVEMEGEQGLHGEPEAAWVFADRMLAVDHEEGKLWLLALYDASEAEEKQQQPCLTGIDAAREWIRTTTQTLFPLSGSPPPPLPPTAAQDVQWRWRWDKPSYVERIRQCLAQIGDGDSYELCLTNQLYTRQDIDPLDFHRHLRRINPAPHAAFLSFPSPTLPPHPQPHATSPHLPPPRLSIVSSSPERFLSLSPSLIAECRPIKGTVPRSPHPATDAALLSSLTSSPKQFAENLMIVDLIRADLARVCGGGGVTVERLMGVESYATVHTMVTTVRGEVKGGESGGGGVGVGGMGLGVVKGMFPAGSMTGAPKVRSVERLRGMEVGVRGVYSGVLGWMGVGGVGDACGGLDLSVVIRTAVVREGVGMSVGVGGAIVYGSDEDEEWDEVLLKAKALMQAARFAVVVGQQRGEERVEL